MALGTGVIQPPIQQLATASAFLAKIPEDLLGDSILDPSLLLWGLTRRGKIGGSGAAINYGTLSVLNLNHGAYYGDQLLNTKITDETQPVEQQWRFYYQAVTIPMTDLILQQGSGMTGIRDVVNLKLTAAAGSATVLMAQSLWHTAPANTTLDIDDIDSWIGQTTNIIGSIDRSVPANSWWLPRASVAAGGALTPATAEVAYSLLAHGTNETPDILTMNPTPYAVFKNSFTQNIRYLDRDEAVAPDGSFRNHFLFNNAVVLPDIYVLAGNAYFANTKYLYPKFHEADYFVIDPWLKPTRQRVYTTTFYWAWNVISPAPRFGGIKITGVGV